MTGLHLALFRISATALAVFGALLAVMGDHAFLRASASPDGWSPEQAAWINRLFAGLWTVEVLLAAVLALALIWRAGHRADARALAWFLGFLTVLNFDLPLGELGLLPPAGAVRSALEVLAGATWWLALAAFLRFSALFPRPLTAAELREAGLAPWRAWLLDGRAVWGGTALLGLLTAGLARFAGSGPGAGAVLAVRLAAFILLLGLVAGFLWGIAQGVRHLRIRYRTAGAEDRRRILWVVQGFSLAMWAIFIGLAGLLPAALAAIAEAAWVWPLLPVLAIAVAPLFIVLFLAVAIFYDGAIDPALVIRRTALYGAFGVVLTFVFAGVENLASSALTDRLGLPESSATWLAAGAVAVVFGFAREWLARIVGRAVAPITPEERTESKPAPSRRPG